MSQYSSTRDPKWSPQLSCVYTCIFSLSSAAVGGGLLLYWSDNFTDNSHLESSTVRTCCLVTGVVLLVFIAVWTCFNILLWQVTKSISRNRNLGPSVKSQEAEQLPSVSPSSLSSCCLPLLGVLCLLLLLSCVALEISLTGLLWWTSHNNGLQYKVVGDCFCYVGQISAEVEDVLQLGCPESCTAVYNAVQSQFASLRQCQLLDGSGLDPDCLEYHVFLSWFKVWRIILPLVVVVQMPVLFFYFCSWFSGIGSRTLQQMQDDPTGGGQQNVATSSISFVNGLVQPPSSVDPVKFYGNICAAVDDKYAHEKQEAIDQVKVQEMYALSSKPATLRSTAVMARSISNIYAPAPSSPPPLTAVACPVPPTTIHEDIHAGLTQDDSPPDIQEHTISTPIQSDQLPITPQFDLSHVVKPKFDVNSKYEFPAHPPPTSSQVKLVKQTSAPFGSSIIRLQSKHTINNNSKSGFELQKFPQDTCHGHSRLGVMPPPPPARSSSVSTCPVSPVYPQLLPPPTPARTSSIYSQPFPSESQSSFSLPRNPVHDRAPPPPLQIRNSSLSDSLPNIPKVQVVVEDASDYDSSTCGSNNSTKPIISSSKPTRQTCKAWPTSPAPTRLQLSSSSAVIGTSPMFYSDIQEISSRARKISSSANVDWSKLP